MFGVPLLLKCVREFTTRESGVPFTVMEDTTWFKKAFDIAPGGYELTVLEKVDGALFTGICVKVRDERIRDCFENVPLRECPEPIDHECSCGCGC